MSKYSTIQQHQPLRAPYEWGTSERRFVAQLEEVLDDIYRRFGRLTLLDLNTEMRKRFTDGEKSVSELLQDATQFKLQIKELQEATPEELVNTSMVLNKDGIFLSGGVIDLQAGTSFRVQSGGAVQIDAKDGENSFIRLGDGNFNATQSGDVSARTGDFAEGLAVGSRPVWHSGNAVVATSRPAGHGILWIRPSETQSVRYAYPTGPNRNVNWVNTTRTFQLTPDTADTMVGGKFTYTLSIPLYETKGTNRYVGVSATISKGAWSVTFPDYEIAKITQWQLQTVTLTVESATNLTDNTDPITLAVTITGATSTGLYLQRDMEITLQIRSDNFGGEAQNCSVLWIP